MRACVYVCVCVCVCVCVFAVEYSSFPDMFIHMAILCNEREQNFFFPYGGTSVIHDKLHR